MREVRAPSAPSQTSEDGACPSVCFQGWKWSLMKTESNPACSAAQPKSSSCPGPNCSADALYPSLSTTASPSVSPGQFRTEFLGGEPRPLYRPQDGCTNMRP